MIKSIKVLVLSFLTIVSSGLFAQDTVQLSFDPSVRGDTLSLKILANQFKSVEVFEINFNYSAQDLQFLNSTTHPNLSVQSLVRDSVYISFSWTNPNAFPLTLPDQSVLIEFRFMVIRKKVQTCFDFNVSPRPTAFFTTLMVSLPVSTQDICRNLFGSVVSGILRLDTNGNCIPENSEPPMGEAIIRFKGLANEFYAITEKDGSYNRFLPDDNYVITSLGTDITQACVGATPVTLNAQNLNFDYSPSISPKVNCAQLQVECNIPVINLCSTNKAAIRFKNSGTIAASDVYIEFALDPNLTLQQSSHNYTVVADHLYRFDLGNLGIQESGQIDLLLNSLCDASFSNRTVQNTVKIFPNEFCQIPTNYSGANLEVIANCTGTESVFEIKNTGSGNMKSEIVFNTVEDDIMPKFGGKIKLDKDGSEFIRFPKDGKSRIILVDTIANHPYKVRASAGLEGCGTAANGTITKGILNNFSQGDEAPQYSRFSTEIKDKSNNPLELMALPEGAGNLHYISNEDRITYSFVIQNLGTETVHRVVLRNTIPTSLNMESLQLARTDVQFEWSIIDNRTLEVIFDNVQLLSRGEDPKRSQLNFAFSIKPMPEITFNSIINNQAYVRFDSRQEFKSSVVRHTIGNFIFTLTEDKTSDKVNINVYPNPTLTSLVFDLKEPGDYIIEYYNLEGKNILKEIVKQQLWITDGLKDQKNGIYFYKVFRNHQFMSSGKITKTGL